jgi:hypothetical protein
MIEREKDDGKGEKRREKKREKRMTFFSRLVSEP